MPLSLSACCFFGISLLYAENETIYELDTFPVQGKEAALGKIPLLNAFQLDPAKTPSTPHMGEALATVPGVAMQRRGANALEPNIRGFNYERISTQFNGVPRLNGAPTRTAAPVNFFGSTLSGTVQVIRSFPSVTDGPMTTGGRLKIESFSPSLASDSGNSLSTRYWSNRLGYQSDLLLGGRLDETIRYRASTQYTNLGNYTAGNGHEIDAEYEVWASNFAIQVTPGQGHTLETAVQYTKQIRVQNSSLPLDSINTDFFVTTVKHQWDQDRTTWRIRAGYSEVNPFLTNAERSTPPGTIAFEIDGETDTYVIALEVEQRWSDRMTTIIGLDGNWQNQDGFRERTLSNGLTFTDPTWPKVHSQDIGVFGELQWKLTQETQFRLGARIDQIEADANKADAPIIGIQGQRGPTVRANYIAFNGLDAGNTNRNDTVGSTNLILEHRFSSTLTSRMGLGFTAATPNVSERYRAFQNAPGGGLDVGNPALEPEQKKEAEIGLLWKTDHLKIGGTVFFASINDYILRQEIEPNSMIFGFRNIDAEFFGGEIAAQWKLNAKAPGLSISSSLASVTGRDLSNRTDLAEIPPLQWRTAGHYEWTSGKQHYWTQIEMKFTDGKTNPNPRTSPYFASTSDYTLWNFRIGAEINNQLSFELFIENLFNRYYIEYLQFPESSTPKKGSQPATPTPIPGIGRSINIAVKWQF